MGFEDQVLAVLEAMGGTLKADDAELAYKQERKAKESKSAKDLVSGVIGSGSGSACATTLCCSHMCCDNLKFCCSLF